MCFVIGKILGDDRECAYLIFVFYYLDFWRCCLISRLINLYAEHENASLNYSQSALIHRRVRTAR